MTNSSTQNLTGSKTTRKPPSNSLKLTAIIALMLLVGGGGAWFYLNGNKSAGTKKNTVKVKRDTVDVSIIATGTIKPISEVKISPKSVAQIKELLVKQGDIVKKGQLLARMDDSNLRGQIEAARGSYLMAKDNYEKAMHGNRPQEINIARLQEIRAHDIVRQAEQNVIRLKANLESVQQQALRDDTMAVRQAYLEQQGAISDQDRLNAETTAKMTHSQFEAAKRELSQAEATLAQNNSELSAAGQQHELSRIGNRSEDIQSARDQVIQAKGSLDSLLDNQQDMMIKAPFDGVITQKYADTGAIVTPTTSAATTSATSSSIVALAGELEMVAEVAETDIGKIKLGQTVKLISNAFPERPFHGRVVQIAPEAVVTQNVTTFEVHTTIDDDRKHRLLSGMNVSASFAAGKMEDVLVVPTVCIVSRHGKTGVLLPYASQNPQFKPVKIGPTVDAQTVVLRGLKDGDVIFLGLNKDQLEQQGYGSATGPGGSERGGRGEGRRGGAGSGSGGGARVPRGLGR